MKAIFVQSEISDSPCLKIQAETIREQYQLNDFFEVEKNGEIEGRVEFVIDEFSNKSIILYKETI